MKIDLSITEICLISDLLKERNGQQEEQPVSAMKTAQNEAHCVKPDFTRWRAEKGENYWTIDLTSFGAKSYEYTDERDDFDERNFDSGNYFRTKEEAQAVADKIVQIFALIRDGVPANEICVKEIEKH